MKRTTIHTSAALALLLALAACTQDEAGFLPEGAEGTPIVFTATGLNPAVTATANTRAPMDGDWEGVQSVAVLMNGTVKTYNVTPSPADNTSATLTSNDPHYWTNRNDITVTAWWPYTEGETTMPVVKVREDQSTQTGYEASDHIAAIGQPVTYGSPTLSFTHRTARVHIALTDYTEGLASVKLTGLSTENGNTAEIVPHDQGSNTYSAFVAPQSVAAGTAFITCTFTDGKPFVYKMKEVAEWKAGGEYTYTISLATADPGYTVSEDGKTYTVHTADGLKNVADLVNSSRTDINITLDKDIDLTGIEWTPIGTNGYQYTGTFNGNGKTITGLTVNQQGTNYVGLFGMVGKNGTVQNLTLENVDISGSYGIGGVAGYNSGTVTACTVTGNISGNRTIGGVVGYNSGSGTVTACTVTGSISGNNSIGGVVGDNSNGTVTACTAMGDVTGQEMVGGVAGYNDTGTVTACYHATGNVSGQSYVGGVAGYNTNGTVTACYWNGSPAEGIGNGQTGVGQTTQVDGQGVTWQTAVDAMNAALQSASSEWRYELTGALPTLKKQ